ncbi:MAG: IPT/TIG domain-containing protein [Ignavibacteria bacterium]|nr:IPT/TIG domain-containing protein [Ignavibacteria bacterium]
MAAQRFTIISQTQIKAIISSGNSGSVSVANPSGIASLSGFTFISSGSGSSSNGGSSGVSPGGGITPVTTLPSPTITSVSQTFGEFGTRIIIRGTRLSQTQFVRFGGVPAQSFFVDSDTQITAIVGNGSSGLISLQTVDGNALWSEAFTFTPALPPMITGVTPQPVFTGDGDYTITVAGRNLSPSSLYSIAPVLSPNDIFPIRLISASSTSAILSVPLVLRRVADYKVMIRNASFSAATIYTVQLGLPPTLGVLSVASTIASSLPFTTILSGNNFFRQSATISINGTLAKFNILSSTRASVEIPKEMNTFGNENLRVRLTNYDTQFTEATLRLNARLAPYIVNVRSIWLDNGVLHLIIEGSGFIGTPRVTLNGQELQVISSNQTTLEVFVPETLIVPSLLASHPVLLVENFDLQRYGYRVAPTIFQQTITSTSIQSDTPPLALYPNPTSDFITVEAAPKCASKPLRITLRNALGVVVMTLEAQSTDGLFRKELNVAHLAPGAYSVETLCGGERLVARFVRF